MQEKPDLIIADVMMPKISGFDMLDILRSTPETKNIKVIMMTALSGDDQRKRGENLGADKYLVKSQVGIEDVISAVHEILGGASGAPVPNLPTPPEIPADQQMPVPQPVIPDGTSASATPDTPVASTAPVTPETPAVPAAPEVPAAPIPPQGDPNAQPAQPEQPATPATPAQ